MQNVFMPEIGHHPLQERIITGLTNGQLPHAFLFHGPEGSGKAAFAIAFAQLLNAPGNPDGTIVDRASPQYLKIANLQHPDVKFIFPTPAKTNVKPEELQEVLQEYAGNPYQYTRFPNKNTFIGIDTIRELKHEAGFKLYEGRKKIFIIDQADRMRGEAANALLKLLEEPPDNLMLILITANVHALLPTIKSRCQMLRFPQMSEEEIAGIITRFQPQVDPAVLPVIIRLSGFNIKRTLDFLTVDVLKVRDTAIDLLRKIVLIQRSQELMQIIEPLAAKKGLAEAKLLLWLLLLWFQDILHLRKAPDKDIPLYNADQQPTLEKFLTFTVNADLEGIVWDIETALGDLRDAHNYNPLLTLTNLALDIHKKLRRT